jgi:outer membrane usher protein
VVLRGGDVFVAVSTLTGSGVHGFAGTRETIGADEFVSLRSLAPKLTFTVDERALKLALTIDPEWLGRVERDLRTGEPAGIEYRGSPSGFLNYAVTASGSHEYELVTESAFNAHGALLYNTATTSATGTFRGLTNVTFDERQSMRRWIVGDSFAGGGVLGGDALIGGITVSREFSLAPYFVRYPNLTMSAAVPTPSVVEVYVNGRLVRQEVVMPGRIDLRNLPLTTGRNETRLVVRDPFGGAREIVSGYYLTSSVLNRGLHDYEYSAGWRRTGFGRDSFDYSEPAFVGRHRVGVTDTITIGGRLEGDRQRLSGGPTLNMRLPFGDLEAAFGASRAGGLTGTAAEAAYVYSGRLVSIGGSAKHTSAAYTTLSLGPGDPRASTEVNIFSSVPLGGGVSLTLQHARAIGGTAVDSQRTSLLGSARLYSSLSVVGTVARNAGIQGRSLEASVSAMVTFGGRAVASTSAVHDTEGTRGVLDLQQPLPAGKGLGYQVRTESGSRDAVNGVLQYQNEYGRYEVRRDTLNGVEHSTVSVSGALVSIGGGVYATRAIRNSFALVKVPGVANVRAYSSHQEIGRTDRHGNLLVPDLLAYYGNQLNISDTDVPIDYVVPDVQTTLAPPYRGGAVALFPVHRVQRTNGVVMLVTAAGERAPAFGELAVDAAGKRLVSPIGDGGEFYFEDLPAGRHDAVVSDGDAACHFEIDVPMTTAASLNLGKLRCAVSVEQPH